MSILKSSNDHLVLNADGTSKDIKFQADGVEKASISSAGAFTSTTIDATKLSGALPILDGSALTGTGSPSITDNGNAEAIVISAEENVGIGVTPESDWRSDYTALQLSTTAAVFGKTSGVCGAMENARSTSSGDKYITASEASSYELHAGQHKFSVAASGSADAAISWGTALQIANDKMITIGDNYTYPASTNYVRLAGAFGQFGYNGTNNVQIVSFINGNGNVGSIWTSGTSTSYNTSSDYRLKNIHGPITDSIERVKSLKPYRFNFIADPGKTVDGFVAHEAGEVVPEAVSGEKDAMRMEEYEITPAVLDDDGTEIEPAVMGEREVIDPQGIDQAKLVPLLTAALQDAIARIEALEA